MKAYEYGKVFVKTQSDDNNESKNDESIISENDGSEDQFFIVESKILVLEKLTTS